MLRALSLSRVPRAHALLPRLSSAVTRHFHAAPALLDRILVVDGIEPVCAQILRDAGHTVDEKSKLPAADLLAIIGNYDGLVVRSETKVTVRSACCGGVGRA